MIGNFNKYFIEFKTEKHKNILSVLCEINKKVIVQIKNLINLTKERTIETRQKTRKKGVNL